VTSWAFLSII